MTKMTAEKTDLQKLKNLLNSATNERQRKMYQALLNKARASMAPESPPPEQKKTKSLTKKTKLPASTKKKKRGKSTKEKASSVNDSISVAEKTSLTTNATAKKNQVGATNNSTSVLETNQIKQKKAEAETQTNFSSPKQSERTIRGDKVASSPASDSTNQAIFQGFGMLKCSPYLEDEKLFVTIDEQQYALKKVIGAPRQQISRLKSELKQNGSRKILLKVYPNITHYPDERPPHHLFRLVRCYFNEEQSQKYPEGFIFRGIWQVVSHCPTPVITIYRNIDRLATYKQLPRVAKKYFVKAQDVPVVWDAPVSPFVYHPEREDSEQMPCYFVQVRATFKDGQYIVTEMLNEPTLDIPRFIQRTKKNSKNRNKSKQSPSKSSSTRKAND